MAYTQRYSYDKLGNIQQLRHTAANAADSFTRRFDYGRGATNYLQQVALAGAQVAYQYDAAGNVSQENGARRYQWDAADQLRQFATWTGAGTALTLLAHYVYAGGQRVKKLAQTSADTWQVTVYAAEGFEHRYEVSQGSVNGEQTQLAVREGQYRLYQRRSGDALGDQRPAALYTLDDHLGSASGQTDATGRLITQEEYYPFGETSFGSAQKQRYRYCGKELDEESGLYYYGARYYTPWVCRFISVDPLAAKYAFYTPYQYAGNKPISFLDLDGLEPAARPAPMVRSMPALVNTRQMAEEAVRQSAANGGRQARLPIGAVTGPGYAYDSYGNQVPAPSYNVYRAPINTLEPMKTQKQYNETAILYETGNAPGIYSYEQYKAEYARIAALGNSLFNKSPKELMFLYRSGGNTFLTFTPAMKDTHLEPQYPGDIPKPGLSTFTNPLQATQGRGGKVQVLSVALLKQMGFVLDVKGTHVGVRPPEPLDTNTLLVQWAATKEPLREGKQPPHPFSMLVKEARVGDEVVPTKKK